MVKAQFDTVAEAVSYLHYPGKNKKWRRRRTKKVAELIIELYGNQTESDIMDDMRQMYYDVKNMPARESD